MRSSGLPLLCMKRRLHAAHPSVPSPATSPPTPGPNLQAAQPKDFQDTVRGGEQSNACRALFAGVTAMDVRAPNDCRYLPTAPCCSRMLATSTALAMAIHRRRWLRVGAESRGPRLDGASCLRAHTETCFHGLGRRGIVLACRLHTGVNELQNPALLRADCAKVAAMRAAMNSLYDHEI